MTANRIFLVTALVTRYILSINGAVDQIISNSEIENVFVYVDTHHAESKSDESIDSDIDNPQGDYYINEEPLGINPF